MRFAALVSLVALGGLASIAVSEERAPVAPSFLMDQEPAEKAQPKTFFLHPGLFPLWKLALTHSESELHRRAAEAIAKAQGYGHEGLSVFQPEMVSLLKQEKAPSTVRYAAAHALIAMDCRDSADALFEASQKDGQDLQQLVEPTLSDWGFAPIQAVWIKRIQAADTPRRELQLAIQGLLKNRVVSAQADILQISLTTTRPADIRLAAARAAGELADTGLEPSAHQLLAPSSPSLINRLCAVSLLERHRSAQSLELNKTLATDSEPAVAGVALRTLFAADPQNVLPLAESSLKSPDAHVRRVPIETYLKLPTLERIQTLSTHLNDPHPELRSLVREGFITHYSDNAFTDLIRELSIGALNGDDWRGQEQAALLLATFDRKEVAPRLVELLRSNRPEVMIATAWALRVLAVPETAPAITEQILRQNKITSFQEPQIESQVSHLCEALAIFKYKPATPALTPYIPKGLKYGPLSRSAAIWALGQIYEDAGAAPSTETSDTNPLTKAAVLLGLKQKPDSQIVEDLASQFMTRIEDTDSPVPEWTEVRRTCSLALGRMKAVSKLEDLKEKIGEEVDNETVEIAMRWAVLRISGEDLPIAPSSSFERTGWFLEPTTRIPTRPSAATK